METERGLHQRYLREEFPGVPAEATVYGQVLANTDAGAPTPSRTRYRCITHRFQALETECKRCTPWFSTYGVEAEDNRNRARYDAAILLQP